MNQDTQFWLTWWVRLAGTIGTFLAVVVALFGEKLRFWIFQPKLTLELVSASGEATVVTLTSADGARQEPGRYYHVTVKNGVRWPAGTQVQIFLVRIEEPGPDGNPQVKWSGAIPLTWQFQEIHELRRTIGPEAIADLCRVIRGKWLDVTLMTSTPPLEPYRMRRVGQAVDMTLMLQARGASAESPITPFRITWNGQWAEGDAEMARNLIIRRVGPLQVSDIGAP